MTIKKSTRLLFVVALAILLVGVLAACSGSTGSQYTPPQTVGGTETVDTPTKPGDSTEVLKPEDGEPVYLSFTYLTQSPSVFKHVYIDEFDLANVEYHITYELVTESDNTVYMAGEGHPLTEDMLDSESRSLITKPGHHMIWASLTTDDDVYVEGSFTLHLKERSQIEFVTLSLNLNGGSAVFGETKNGVTSVNVLKGSSYTWSEFVSEFPVSKEVVGQDGKKVPQAISAWGNYNSNSSAITINSDTTLAATWTNDTVGVTFDLNLPSDVSVSDANDWNTTPPASVAAITPAAQTVEREVGVIPRPDVTNLTILSGYSFAGWFTDAGVAWNFSSKIGATPVTKLTARWTVRSYSYTFIMMGGVVNESYSPASATVTDKTKADVSVSYYNGYHEGEVGYDPNYTANLSTDMPFKFVVSGLNYGAALSDYTLTFKPTAISASDVTVNLGDFVNALKKGDDYYYVQGLYSSSAYLESEKYTSTIVNNDQVLYVKWGLDTALSASEKNAYFVDYLYDYTVKADGTLRIDLIKDTAISELIVPGTMTLADGNTYNVTEIGPSAGINLKSLVTINATGASHLTTIDTKAFAYCPALREVKGPTGGNVISFVGDDAFASTYWINHYADEFLSDGVTANPNAGKSFVVIGEVVVKYVGDNEVTALNLDSAAFPELAGAKSIASGAIKGYQTLLSVSLGNVFETINDNAFYNCNNLVSVTAGTGLTNVGYNAFRNTSYITTAPADNPETLDIDESDFLRLGDIYYRYIGVAKATATVPDGIKIIAPKAFAGARDVQNVVFQDPTDIVKIGESAFSDTRWITSACTTSHEGTYISRDGFVVINYILVSYTGRSTTVYIPRNVKTIASRAFSGLSNNNITNVVFYNDCDIEEIESEAFYGATSLSRISFTNDTDAALIKISTDSFSGKTGELVNKSLKLCLYKTPLTTAGGAVQEGDSAILVGWKNLYANYPRMFSILKTVSAKLNPSVVPTAYLYDNAAVDFKAAWTAAGVYNALDDAIVNGVIVSRSDGIDSVENLPYSRFTFTDADKAIGLNKTFTFTYPGGMDSSNNPVDVQGTLYKYDVYAAIDSATLAVKHKVNNVETAGFPTFYNSQASMPTAGIYLAYNLKDGNATASTLSINDDMVTITGYKSSVGTRTVDISIDYYGLTVYTMNGVPYTVQTPADVAIEQASALSVPVNSTARDYFSGVKLVVTKNDGSARYISLSDGEVTIISAADANNKNIAAEAVVPDTSVLGYCDIGVRYGTNKEGYVFCEIIYAVILSSDPSMFTYDKVSSVDKTVAIKGVNNGHTSTLVIPSKVKLNAELKASATGETYTVVKIGDSAFENRTTLEYVYLPASVTAIGNKAFMGCTALKQLRSFYVQEAGETPSIDLADVTVMSEDMVYTSTVTITGLASNAPSAEIIIPATQTLAKTAVGTDGCIRNITYNSSVQLDVAAFTGYAGKITLPDTAYFHEFATTNLADNENVSFYTVGGEVATANRFLTYSNLNEPAITAASLTGDVKLKSDLDLTAEEDGSLVIPSTIGSTVEANGYVTVSVYTVAAAAEAAFSGAYGDGVTSLYLPCGMREINGARDVFYGGHEADLNVQVYNENEDFIYAPSFKFSATVKTIGNQAFRGCTALENVDFSEAIELTSVGNYAFYDCDTLTLIDFSKTKLTDIDAYTFAMCDNLQSVAFAADTASIGNGAFENCYALKDITNAESVAFVGTYAFHNCRAMTRFYVYPTLAGGAFGESILSGCTGLDSVWIMTAAASEAITSNTYGSVLADTDVVLAIKLADGKEHDANFTALFEKYSGTVGTNVQLGGVDASYDGVALKWGADGTITCSDENASYVLEMYVRK